MIKIKERKEKEEKHKVLKSIELNIVGRNLKTFNALCLVAKDAKRQPAYRKICFHKTFKTIKTSFLQKGYGRECHMNRR